MTFSKLVKLGEGFFGEVWREHDDGLDRDCAAKYLDLSKLASSADVFAEAKLIIDAEHDHVVVVHSADIEAGTPVIRMEYLPDGSVADRFAGQPAPPAAVVTIIQDACRGVEHLHSRGLLHRDIKPANLLLGRAGVKVSDFGLACRQSAAATAVSIRYDLHCPPETLAVGGAIETRQGDVWALGMTAYRLLCGDDVVWQAASDAADFADAVVSGKFPPKTCFPIYVHDKLRNAVLAALRPNPARRLQSAARLRHRLEQAEPYVSWRPDRADDRKWFGDAQDERHCSVTIAERPRGGWQVTVLRAQQGKPSRRIADDCVNVPGLDAALEHAGAVMRRLAASNR